jgi:hypothetical protein
MYLGFHQYQLHFDLVGLLLLAAAIAGLALFTCLVLKKRKSAALLLLASVAFVSAVQVSRGWMVPETAWLAMLGAIEASEGKVREEKILRLKEHWRYRTMRTVDWYRLAQGWGVCHALWLQDQCQAFAPSEQAVGIAREMLDNFASK